MNIEHSEIYAGRLVMPDLFRDPVLSRIPASLDATHVDHAAEAMDMTRGKTSADILHFIEWSLFISSICRARYVGRLRALWLGSPIFLGTAA